MVGLDNSKAIVTKSIVGALTRDEIQFAGAGKNSNTHYLMDNATAVPNSNGKDSSYLTITPDAYAPRSAGGMIYVPVDSDGSIGYIDFENIYYRPAVVLKNTVTAITDSTSQYAPGTYQNPYKVN